MAKSQLSEEHRAAISEGLRKSDKAFDYHQNRQRGRKRKPFSVEWRAKMSVSRRLRGHDKNSDLYQAELRQTIERLSAEDARRAANEGT